MVEEFRIQNSEGEEREEGKDLNPTTHNQNFEINGERDLTYVYKNEAVGGLKKRPKKYRLVLCFSQL